MKVITQDQLQHYREHGYVHLPGVLPSDVIALARTILEHWVDRLSDQWKAEGLITDGRKDLDFWHRLPVLWNDAGKPKYSRSPRAEIVSPETHSLLSHESIVDIAEDLLGSSDVYVHEVFNARPKLPGQKWTNTPWHQDAQYKGISATHHVPTLWFPLQDVDEEYSCLGVAEDFTDGKLYEPFEDETGFLGIAPEDRKHLVSKPIPMKVGDVLCFPSLTPHHANPNNTDKVRWSIDIRYQTIENARAQADECDGLGFVARTKDGSGGAEDFDTWWNKGWEGREW
jgi:hypothetical protein